MSGPQRDVTSVYRAVIDSTISKVKSDFLQEGVDESVLDELRILWEHKLQQSGVLGDATLKTVPYGVSSLQDNRQHGWKHALPGYAGSADAILDQDATGEFAMNLGATNTARARRQNRHQLQGPIYHRGRLGWPTSEVSAASATCVSSSLQPYRNPTHSLNLVSTDPDIHTQSLHRQKQQQRYLGLGLQQAGQAYGQYPGQPAPASYPIKTEPSAPAPAVSSGLQFLQPGLGRPTPGYASAPLQPGRPGGYPVPQQGYAPQTQPPNANYVSQQGQQTQLVPAPLSAPAYDAQLGNPVEMLQRLGYSPHSFGGLMQQQGVTGMPGGLPLGGVLQQPGLQQPSGMQPAAVHRGLMPASGSLQQLGGAPQMYLGAAGAAGALDGRKRKPDDVDLAGQAAKRVADGQAMTHSFQAIPQLDGKDDDAGEGNPEDTKDGGEDDGEEGEPEDRLSDLDSDSDEEQDVPNVVLAQFEKVTRTKNRWKCVLSKGIMHLGGCDVLFSKATGEMDF